MKEKKVGIASMILLSVVFLVGGLVAGYFIGSHSHNQFPYGQNRFQEFNNSTLDNQTRASIVDFFDSNPSQDSVASYCQENPQYCMYYCREINSNNEFCGQMGMPYTGNSVKR